MNLNGDGATDLALDNITVLLNSDNGTFGAPLDYSGGHNPHSIAAADLNIDGRIDFAVPDLTRNRVGLMFGTCLP